MNKEEFKNIISKKLGYSDDSAFNQFIEKIASSIVGDQALKFEGIGYFQIKKEPLSRMEGKMDGKIGKKEIMLFLPEGEVNEENILSFEIDEKPETPNEFSDSVFDIGINKFNIIFDPDGDVPEEGSSIVDESLLNSITEFVGSGEVVDGYKFFDEAQSDSLPSLEDDISTDEDALIDDIILESKDDIISDDEIIENNDEIVSDEYNVTYSAVEVEITDEDVKASEAGILKSDEESEIPKIDDDAEIIKTDDESEISKTDDDAEITKTDDGTEIPKIDDEVGIPKTDDKSEIPKTDDEADILKIYDETENDAELEAEIDAEIEAKIGAEFKTGFQEEKNESIKEEKNPFDELDEYIKDDSKDEAQDVIDGEPKVVEEDLKSDYKSITYSEFDEQTNKWYKNPILYISTLGIIAVFVVAYLFIPITSLIQVEDEANSFIVDDKNLSGLIDSVSASDSTIKNIIPVQTSDEKLAEVKNVEEKVSVKVNEKIVTQPKVNQPRLTNSTGLYREIKNDKSITKRIYFDGKHYTVQSSSWRSTSIAEREVRKLKKRGFDAFIYKTFIESKNGTWNRVRIGYFNTQEEAKEFLKKNKI